MLTIEEGQKIIEKLILLRSKVSGSKNTKDIKELKQYENYCVSQFLYLVTMRTNKYKKFLNHDDLVQEGLEALTKSIKNYDPKKGIFFYWAHKYIDTRISRSANLHTAIRFPLKFAKENTPHKETSLPVIIEHRYCPDKQLENVEVAFRVQNAMSSLTEEQRVVINLVFGFDGDKPLSINKICKKIGISRVSCKRIIDNALTQLKMNIKI